MKQVLFATMLLPFFVKADAEVGEGKETIMRACLVLLVTFLTTSANAVRIRHLTPEEWRRENAQRKADESVEFDIPPLPTDEELQHIYQGEDGTTWSNVNRVCKQRFSYGKYYSEQELRRVGYQLLTNAVVRPYVKFGRYNLNYLESCLLFPGLADDANIMYLCIEMLGKNYMLPEATNEIRRLKIRPRPNTAAGSWQWAERSPNSAHKHNRMVEGTHKTLYRIVKDLAGRQDQKLTEAERSAFRTNITERARLLPDEAAKLFAD